MLRGVFGQIISPSTIHNYCKSALGETLSELNACGRFAPGTIEELLPGLPDVAGIEIVVHVCGRPLVYSFDSGLRCREVRYALPVYDTEVVGAHMGYLDAEMRRDGEFCWWETDSVIDPGSRFFVKIACDGEHCTVRHSKKPAGQTVATAIV